jgi:hypothetical protein
MAIDYVIPGNDDSAKAVTLYARVVLLTLFLKAVPMLSTKWFKAVSAVRILTNSSKWKKPAHNAGNAPCICPQGHHPWEKGRQSPFFLIKALTTEQKTWQQLQQAWSQNCAPKPMRP